ncbi:MlaD family protein [Pseudonocardia sp. H11422]|uniref:MlaD family protein n=1 Tax=Pseudonocardia sp. H11422 TaxID=2835866 RepID=UPI0027E25A9A|nr:MlaD family protein [Pseudonocardia sp. H11422]
MNALKTWSFRRTWQRLRTVPGLGRDVIALTGLVAVGVTAAVLILSQMNYLPPWSDKTVFDIEFDEAVAVSPGNGQEVRIAGVPVGVITDSQATDHNTSRVTVAIDQGHPVYDNARAVLRPVNPLNQMYISLDPGGPPGEPLPEGGMIPVTQTSRPIQAEEVLNHLDERSRLALTALLAESDTALASAPQLLPADLRATQKSLVDLRPVMQQLADRREHIRQFVTALSQIATAAGDNDERLTSLVNSTQQTLAVLTERDAELRQTLGELPGLSTDLRQAMSSTSALTTQLNPTLDNLDAAAEDLPGALDRLGDTTQQVRDTVAAAAPVVAKARPVVDDLRPVVTDLRGTFGELAPVTRWADYATAHVAPWMYDLGAFVYNTSGIFNVSDAQGGLARAQLQLNIANPTAIETPEDMTTNTYRHGESPLGPYPAPGEGGPR